MRKSWLWLLLAAVVATAGCPAHAANFDVRPEEGLLARLLPHQARQFELGTLPAQGGRERFRISSANDHIEVAGSTPSALLFGLNWYLKYVAHVQISPNGDRVGRAAFPLPRTMIERSTPYAYRLALNENVDGYSAPYWSWPRWQREIDVLALSGINAVLLERGTDSVLYRTFRDFGYSDSEIRRWLAAPAHQNWQLMGNLCCFGGPLSRVLLKKRLLSAQRIVALLRELGITPVLPGYYGIVPADLQRRFPDAHVVPQGEWAGFTRPGWLDPRDPMFARLAAAFYRHQRELFGDSGIYDMEVFQEGGQAGDVPVPQAARAVQTGPAGRPPRRKLDDARLARQSAAGPARRRRSAASVDRRYRSLAGAPRAPGRGISVTRPFSSAGYGSSVDARRSAPTSVILPIGCSASAARTATWPAQPSSPKAWARIHSCSISSPRWHGATSLLDLAAWTQGICPAPLRRGRSARACRMGRVDTYRV